jgi:ribosomal protein S4
MSKIKTSKYKIDRRLGVNLWGRPKSPFNKRESRPGQHGQRRRKLSDFGTQLAAKQKLKGYYGNISEKQFRRLYQEAGSRRGDTGENLIELLERRLDAAVYRARFVPTVFAARQFVNHGHVKVNGKRVNVGSYRLSDGAGGPAVARARRAGLYRRRLQEDAGDLRARPEIGRRAVPRADGAEPRDRVLLALIRRSTRNQETRKAACGPPFSVLS